MKPNPCTSAMQRRVSQARSRAAVRAWEYRQRHHAKGVWFRLRRLLAEASSVWEVPEEACTQLLAEGFKPLAAGLEIEPAKSIFLVPEDILSNIQDRRALPLRLGPEFFAARYIVLVPFPASGR